MLPWAINGLPGDDHDKPATQVPQLAQQPLTGLGGGETIREVHQDSPFSMVAVTAEDLTGTTARVRAKKTDGSWGPWYDAETMEGVGPDSPVPRGTEPVFVGRTTTVQISVTRPVGAATTGAPAKAPAKPGLGYVPANVEQPFAQIRRQPTYEGLSPQIAQEGVPGSYYRRERLRRPVALGNSSLFGPFGLLL